MLVGTETAFACDPATQREPDDTAAQAFALPSLPCVSSPYVADGCLATGDPQDWFKLHTPTGCSAVEVEARLTYPVSWESVGFELWDLSSMTMLASDTNCKLIATAGEVAACITFTVNTNSDYGIVVKPKDSGNCGGRCSFNRYNLTVQLATPG